MELTVDSRLGNRLRQPDFLLRTLNLYAHPSTCLWRAIEAREIWREFTGRALKSPVLDLGCGDGRFSGVVFNCRSIDVGLDISTSAMSLAKRSSNYTHVVAADASRLPFRDEAFETVFSNSVLEHIPALLEVLVEARRVLKRGGVLVFSVPSPNFLDFLFFPSLLHRVPLLKSLGGWYSRNRNALLSHNNIWPLNLWKNKLESVGFQTVQGRFCLSKAALQVWDVTALMIYLFRTPLRGSPKVRALLVRHSQRLRVGPLRRILGIFYVSLSSQGADMIITAETNQQAIASLTHKEEN